MQHENPLLALVLPVLLQNYLCIMLGKVGVAGRAGWYFNALKQTPLPPPLNPFQKAQPAYVFRHVLLWFSVMSFTLGKLRAALIDYMCWEKEELGEQEKQAGLARQLGSVVCFLYHQTLRIHVHRTRPHHFSIFSYPTQWQLCFSSATSRPIAREVSSRYSL